MSTICFEPVAFVESPHKDIQGMPIQPVGALGVRGAIVFQAEYELGLQDMDGFSSVIVIYHLHRCAPGFDLLVKPYLDPTPRGVFATRSPRRPNSIGFSVLKLLGVEGRRLLVENVDILDQTPVLDVKPYVPRFDVWDSPRTGWLADTAHKAQETRSDERFHGAKQN